MRPHPKKSYSLDLNTAEWKALDIQEKCFNASWSPDKKTIALECFGKGLNEIYFYDITSESLKIVTDCLEKGHICGLPNWSIDGHWLAYVRSEGKSGPAIINGIYAFNTSCVPNNNCMKKQLGPIQSDSNQIWSTDNKLIFAHSGFINSFDPNSSALKKTSKHLPESPPFTIKVSPDGKRLAFTPFRSSTIYLYSKETDSTNTLIDDRNILSIIGWIVIP